MATVKQLRWLVWVIPGLLEAGWVKAQDSLLTGSPVRIVRSYDPHLPEWFRYSTDPIPLREESKTTSLTYVMDTMDRLPDGSLMVEPRWKRVHPSKKIIVNGPLVFGLGSGEIWVGPAQVRSRWRPNHGIGLHRFKGRPDLGARHRGLIPVSAGSCLRFGWNPPLRPTVRGGRWKPVFVQCRFPLTRKSLLTCIFG
jgi:hypothetical protein